MKKICFNTILNENYFYHNTKHTINPNMGYKKVSGSSLPLDSLQFFFLNKGDVLLFGKYILM